MRRPAPPRGPTPSGYASTAAAPSAPTRSFARPRADARASRITSSATAAAIAPSPRDRPVPRLRASRARRSASPSSASPARHGNGVRERQARRHRPRRLETSERRALARVRAERERRVVRSRDEERPHDRPGAHGRGAPGTARRYRPVEARRELRRAHAPPRHRAALRRERHRRAPGPAGRVVDLDVGHLAEIRRDDVERRRVLRAPYRSRATIAGAPGDTKSAPAQSPTRPSPLRAWSTSDATWPNGVAERRAQPRASVRSAATPPRLPSSSTAISTPRSGACVAPSVARTQSVAGKPAAMR